MTQASSPDRWTKLTFFAVLFLLIVTIGKAAMDRPVQNSFDLRLRELESGREMQIARNNVQDRYNEQLERAYNDAMKKFTELKVPK